MCSLVTYDNGGVPGAILIVPIDLSTVGTRLHGVTWTARIEDTVDTAVPSSNNNYLQVE